MIDRILAQHRFPALLYGMIIAMTLTGCASTKTNLTTESAPQAAMIAEPPVIQPLSEQSSLRLVDVWLLPMEGFPNAYVNDLIERLTKDTGLNIRATVAVGRSPAMAFPDGKQYNGDKIISELRPAMYRLAYEATPTTAYIILTTEDINQPDRMHRFMFAITIPNQNAAVVSIARMQPDNTPALTKLRLLKMTKKAIGTLYYKHPRNTDMNSVMYSPIMGLDDLDMIGTAY